MTEAEPFKITTQGTDPLVCDCPVSVVTQLESTVQSGDHKRTRGGQ